MAWLAGIHPGEQMKAAISPDASNLYFFQNPAAKTVFNQDSGANTDMPVQFFGLRQWMATMSAGNLNAQTAAFGPHAHPALTDLPNMQGVDSTVLGLNAESGGFEGQRSAATLDAIDVIKDFLLKMASHNQAKENDLSENTKMAVAGKGSRLSHWAPSHPNSETLRDPQLQGQHKNVQSHKFQAAVKTSDNLANPQNAADAMMAKPSEDLSGIKNPNLKTQMPLADTIGNKVIQVEGDNKDSSLLYAQDQMPDRMLRLENAAHTSESAQRSLASQAMNQIVQKAVLSFHNGQSEVQIHLKPEFLGHIRMQIVTENQQVAIKILAELPFVKDMLESNLNQLKADLQAQGLKIDQLEVSVAHDSRADDDQHQKAAEARRARALKNSRSPVDAAAEEQTDVHTGRGDGMAETAIDYFA
jgi:flagellar hook-length control protein FliK